MANVDILFVFQRASQWVALTGKGPLSGDLCEPDMVILSDDGDNITVDGSRTNGSFTFNGASRPTFPVSTTLLTVRAGKTPSFSFRATDTTGAANVFKLTGAAFQRISTAPEPGSQRAFKLPVIEVGLDVPTGFVMVSLTKGGTIHTNVRVMAENADGEVGLIWPLISNVT